MSLLVKHFVSRPRAIELITTLEISAEEKQKLAELITLLYHQQLLNHLLSALSLEDRKVFMESYLNEDHAGGISFLQEKIVDIEKVVAEALLEIEDRIIADMKDIESMKG